MSLIPTVSVVILAYHNRSYLSATIESILQQTYDNFEILVFYDDYHQIYSWFEREPDSRLRFILQSDLGLATILNQGISEARGQYISIIESGDLWHLGKLQKQVFCLDHYSQVDLVHSASISNARQNQGFSHHFAIEPDLSIGLHAMDTMQKPIANRIPVAGKHSSTSNYDSEILAQNQLVLSSVMLRRSCFERVGLFDPELQIAPDWEMWIRLSHYYQFMAIAEPLVYSRQLRQSQSENWLKLETDLHIIIEKTYVLSPEQKRQKQRSYGYANLFLTKYVLHHKIDPAIAHNYWYQALQHDPLIVFSTEFCRLRWLIFNLYCLQSDRYCNLLQLIKTVGERLRFIMREIREYSQKTVDWMLEEEGINFWKNRQVNSTPPVKDGACVHFVKRQGKD